MRLVATFACIVMLTGMGVPAAIHPSSQRDLQREAAEQDKIIWPDPKGPLICTSGGDARLQESDLDAAIAEYGKTTALDARMLGANAEDLRSCRQNPHMPLAIDGCTRIINAENETQSNRAFAYYMRGAIYLMYVRNDLDHAIDDFTQAIRFDPDAGTYFMRGQAWLNKRGYDLAIADYTEAIRLEPTARHYIARASAWQAKKEYDRAIADYNEAARLGDPAAATSARVADWSQRRDQ